MGLGSQAVLSYPIWCLTGEVCSRTGWAVQVPAPPPLDPYPVAWWVAVLIVALELAWLVLR